MRSKHRSYVGLLLVAFLVLVFGGRLVFQHSVQSAKQVSISDAKKSTAILKEPDSNQSQTTTKPTKENTVTECITAMNADVAAQKTEYEKGSILVTFKKTFSYDQATDVLAVYGLKPQDESHARQSYSAQALIVATVPQGSEISKICSLRRDDAVAYAGLNVLFSLHE